MKERAEELFASAPEIHELDVLADKLPRRTDDRGGQEGPSAHVRAEGHHEQDGAEFLRGARSIVEEEPQTIAWFAVRLDDGQYGIFDAFPDNRGRFAHLTGRVPRELAKHGLTLLGGLPDMDMNSVLAVKLPD